MFSGGRESVHWEQTRSSVYQPPLACLKSTMKTHEHCVKSAQTRQTY